MWRGLGAAALPSGSPRSARALICSAGLSPANLRYEEAVRHRRDPVARASRSRRPHFVEAIITDGLSLRSRRRTRYPAASASGWRSPAALVRPSRDIYCSTTPFSAARLPARPALRPRARPEIAEATVVIVAQLATPAGHRPDLVLDEGRVVGRRPPTVRLMDTADGNLSGDRLSTPEQRRRA